MREHQEILIFGKLSSKFKLMMYMVTELHCATRTYHTEKTSHVMIAIFLLSETIS